MTTSTRSASSGFTLIEVLVGLLVLTIVILTSLAVFADRSRRMSEAGEMALAWQVLANEAEAQRRQPFGALATADGVSFLTDPTGGGALKDAAGKITVTEEGPYLRALAMRIEWGGGTRSAETIVYRASTGGGTLW
ncbi:MAG TPA: prepilin-type N-terminal cleavage/methylation domain-containing protein [Thermoanaerobaculia bacterium]|nr:prepilin-type N-terminal cleavage/methylation domain-containing protein [Thermoanaerobaculia bacterium]